MASIHELSPINWIIRIAIGAIGISFTGTLLRIEYSKRKSMSSNANSIPQSKYLRYSSLSCLWCGLISSLLITLSAIPIFCMMRLIASYLAYLLQLVSLGFYQLSRLYYSFSKQQLHVHQKQGYPWWVFKVMTIYGISIPIVAIVLLPMVFPPVATCTFTNDASFLIVYHKNVISNTTKMFHILYWSGSLYWMIWDITTFLLYLHKIWKMSKIHRSKEDGVWSNIQFILQRIVILTVFYQFCSLMTSLWYPLAGYVTLSDDMESALEIHRPSTIILINVIVDSLAIFMMMDHNTTAYVRFLRVLRVLRLKLCCFCCWHRMVDRQLEALDTAEVTEPIENDHGIDDDKEGGKVDCKERKKTQTSTYQTRFSNISKNVEYRVNLEELSESSKELNICTVHEEQADRF